MLDDLRKIHERDAQDALGAAGREWQQLALGYDTAPTVHADHIRNVVYSGMGNSAIAARLACSWLPLTRPFEVVQGYDIPAYVNQNTLFIAASYSGNTEETIESLGTAARQGAQIVAITGGGKLAEIAQNQGYAVFMLPKTRQSRFALLAELKTVATALEQAGLCTVNQIELTTTADFLKTAVAAWTPTVAVKNNVAKQIALECMGKSVVVYAGPTLAPAADRWKASINENAKQIAWHGEYPESGHDDLIGWSKHPEQKPYAVVDLRSNLEHTRVQKQFEVAERLLSGLRPAAYAINVEGETPLQQLLWAVLLGDFVGVYLGLLNGVNPMPLDLTEKNKQRVSEQL